MDFFSKILQAQLELPAKLHAQAIILPMILLVGTGWLIAEKGV